MRAHYGSLNSLLGWQHSRQQVTSPTQTIFYNVCNFFLKTDNNIVTMSGPLLPAYTSKLAQ